MASLDNITAAAYAARTSTWTDARDRAVAFGLTDEQADRFADAVVKADALNLPTEERPIFLDFAD